MLNTVLGQRMTGRLFEVQAAVFLPPHSYFVSGIHIEEDLRSYGRGHSFDAESTAGNSGE